MHDTTAALILPFDREILPFPQRCFLLRAEPAQAFDGRWRAVLACEQSFKPTHDALALAGFHVSARLDGRYPMGLCLLTKHKVENRANLARAWDLLEPGGLLVVSGANAIGAASVEREVEQALGLEGRLSKHQARTFWLRRSETEPAVLAEWRAAAQARLVPGTGLVARAGCFSPDHADTGSLVLADCFPDTMAGRVADLGAGWGYLGARLLERFPAVTGLDSFEAEALALDDARANLDAIAHAAQRSYHWHDVTKGLPKAEPYDWIIANPPFHDGTRADPAIGRAFIAAAWGAVRRRGKVLLVANQHLPYEAELRKRFREVEQVRVAEGFKVFWASNRVDVVR